MICDSLMIIDSIIDMGIFIGESLCNDSERKIVSVFVLVMTLWFFFFNLETKPTDGTSGIAMHRKRGKLLRKICLSTDKKNIRIEKHICIIIVLGKMVSSDASEFISSYKIILRYLRQAILQNIAFLCYFFFIPYDFSSHLGMNSYGLSSQLYIYFG